MALSYDLISQFAKQVVKTSNRNKSESTVYGTVKLDANGNKYVMLDGSDQLTPLTDDERPAADSTSANANDGERVSVLIKNHTATVTGNISSPAARTGDVEKLEDSVSEIQEFDILIGQQVTANEGYIKQLQTDKANVGDLNAATAKITELETKKASIEELNAAKAEITDLKTNKLDTNVANITYATIESLDSTNADISNLNADYVKFKEATGEEINTVKGNITNLNTSYATIDFANIGEAAIEKLFSESGIIESLVMSDGRVTGELVGVTISGDVIKGNTIQADKLIVKGEDGLYHKLNIEGGVTTTETLTDEDLQNGLHGSVIIAKSITADQVAVTDLVAFDATIGGFKITDSAIHTVTKDSVGNSSQGVYLDKEGQFAIGDENNYIKYFKDADNAYKLMIAADNITAQIKSATEALEETMNKVNKHFSFTDNGLVISNGENAMSIRIDNDIVIFEKNGVQFGWWDGINFHTGNIMIDVAERAQFGNFAFVPRTDGSLSFLKVAHNTGFYAVLGGGVLFIYGAYPTLEDDTMVVSGTDITGELSETTLILNGGQ